MARTLRTRWVTLECPECGDLDEYPEQKVTGPLECHRCGEILDPNDFVDETWKTMKINKQAGLLYPNLVAPEDFAPGDVVRKIFGDFRVTEYLGVVLAVHPTTNTVDIKWPFGIGFENPQDLVRVNPWFEPPSVVVDSSGYYTTWDTERWNTLEHGSDPTKGVSGRSPCYQDIQDVTRATIASNLSSASITTTENSGNSFTVSVDFEKTKKQETAVRVAKRFAKRSFNHILRVATISYNERCSAVETYNFLCHRLGGSFSEPAIRQVVSYLYGHSHNYYIEEFDKTLQKAIKAAQLEDEKSLRDIFLHIISFTGGKKTLKLNDLITASIEAPYAEALYHNIKEAIQRSKGDLDLLPTPAARFAKIIEEDL